jgi:predicted regulator of Ras-like GTPase activity (Roadblock/LC7/MglB family)
MTDTPELGWLLDDLVSRVPGITKALVLSRDGLCYGASATLRSEDADRLAAMAASFHSLARGAVQELDGGEVHQVIVEMNSAFLFTTAAGEGTCLAVVSSADVDVGMVAYEMALLVRRVSRHLSVQSRGAVTSGGEVT